jgi:hypothetical protein
MLPGLLYHLSHGQLYPGSKRLSPLSPKRKGRANSENRSTPEELWDLSVYVESF